MTKQFTCEMCGETFIEGWSDEEAKAESEALFGMTVTEETHAAVCDDCFKAFMKEATQ